MLFLSVVDSVFRDNIEKYLILQIDANHVSDLQDIQRKDFQYWQIYFINTLQFSLILFRENLIHVTNTRDTGETIYYYLNNKYLIITSIALTYLLVIFQAVSWTEIILIGIIKNILKEKGDHLLSRLLLLNNKHYTLKQII